MCEAQRVLSVSIYLFANSYQLCTAYVRLSARLQISARVSSERGIASLKYVKGSFLSGMSIVYQNKGF